MMEVSFLKLSVQGNPDSRSCALIRGPHEFKGEDYRLVTSCFIGCPL
jgi:hypothetical protein